MTRFSQPAANEATSGFSRRNFLSTAVAGSAVAAAAVPRRAMAAGEKRFKVAWISPQSGPLAAFGSLDKFAYDMLAQQLREGLKGPKGELALIDVTIHDAGSTPQGALALANKIAQTDVNMVVVTATPEICNPVSDVCEAAGIPCVATVCPWQAWFHGRKGDPIKGFDWTYLFFAGLEDFSSVYTSLLSKSKLGPRIGGLFGDDIDGAVFLDAFNKTFKSANMQLALADGFVKFANPNFKQIAQYFKSEGIQAVTGNLPPPLALAFIEACDQVGYTPKMASIAKAFPFPEIVAAAHRKGMVLTNEVIWSPAWPFRSGVSGINSKQLSESYKKATGKTWVPIVGFSYALLEVVGEACRLAPDTSREAVRHEVARLRVNTVVGPINWRDRHPNKNVCTTPAVGGQWMKDSNGEWALQVVDNTRSPFIPETAKLTLA